MKCSPTLLAMLGPPLVHGARGAGDGTAQDTKVRPLLSARAVTTVHVDPELVYLLVEVVEYRVIFLLQLSFTWLNFPQKYFWLKLQNISWTFLYSMVAVPASTPHHPACLGNTHQRSPGTGC